MPQAAGLLFEHKPTLEWRYGSALKTFSDPNTIQSPMMALAQLLPSKKQRVAYCQFCLVESNDGKPSWSYLSQPELEVRRQTGHREETKWTSEALASCQELGEVHEHWPAVMWSFQRDTPIVLAQPPISCLTFFPASLQASAGSGAFQTDWSH